MIRHYLQCRHQTLEDHWIIGDTEADIGAGKLLQLRTAAVLSGIRNVTKLKEQNPDFLLPDIRGLRSVIAADTNQSAGRSSPTP